MTKGPRGWYDGKITTRFVATPPSSYDAASHTVDCVISAGVPVKRFYGTEILRIDAASINLNRVRRGVALLLDSHQTDTVSGALGRIANAWIEGARLIGRLVFNDTERGRFAEGMVARREISGVSAGYSVQSWQVSDEDGRVLNPDFVNSNDDDLTFTATAWTLMECSLVAIPADSSATIRSDSLAHARARMQARQTMSDRMSQYNDNCRR